MTGLSGVIALVIGVVGLSQWAGDHFPAAARVLAALQDINVSPLGFWLAGLTLILFTLASLRYRQRTLRRQAG